MVDLFNKENKGANFSKCGNYRYSLWRIWDESKPLVMFIGLNPSTANATSDDPTIRRVKAIARNLGYGGVYMMNCFPFVTAYPKELQKGYSIESQYRNFNDLQYIADKCSIVIFAWGNFKAVDKNMVDVLTTYFPNAKALHINKNGSPKHPLYCKANIQPVNFK